MRLLFLSYHYPGPFEPLARWLAAQGNEILFASIRSTRVKDGHIPGVRRVIIRHFSPLADPSFIDVLDNATCAARNAFDSLSTIRDSGFEPEIIFTFSSDGSALSIPDIFPKALWINFLELQPDDRQNPVQWLQILKANQTYAFYPSQILRFPKALSPLIKPMKPMVDTEFFSPLCERMEHRLAVFCYRKEEEVSALVRQFLAASGKNKAVIIASNVPSLRKLNAQFDGTVQVTLAGTREERRELFRMANIAYFDFPCHNLIESMTCGCPTFVAPAFPESDRPDNILVYAGTEISRLLNNPEMLAEYGGILRETAVSQYSLQAFMPGWFNSLQESHGQA